MKVKEFLFRCTQLGLFTFESAWNVTVFYIADLGEQRAHSGLDIDISKILSEKASFPAEVYLRLKQQLAEFIQDQKNEEKNNATLGRLRMAKK